MCKKGYGVGNDGAHYSDSLDITWIHASHCCHLWSHYRVTFNTYPMTLLEFGRGLRVWGDNFLDKRSTETIMVKGFDAPFNPGQSLFFYPMFFLSLFFLCACCPSSCLCLPSCTRSFWQQSSFFSFIMCVRIQGLCIIQVTTVVFLRCTVQAQNIRI